MQDANRRRALRYPNDKYAMWERSDAEITSRSHGYGKRKERQEKISVARPRLAIRTAKNKIARGGINVGRAANFCDYIEITSRPETKHGA